ncbi:MAG: hypothetical protein A3H96_08955 [Acidobacteria bacterium RIFCSPLOWO2_02_FULL_67_36]|nr:MAG: hypothetical protein A3H96_08955 [Acidobacteria bacterium RIFCSPLOWO2_02_FULL_67_36]OFW25090.1 MAG: hypothetical protein A3G21_16780 [Acidobacteria bacterium RIFCSPLOWO2_12_FULL_66_21]
MGEVYRADDLKLGQPVALKFLPLDVDRDPARLTQLHTEVRMARQVSHPNVCRVYDIDEIEGHTFISMEYVDGEDLASLLRRVGRFPQDRALEIARQICAGLAAAHERGVVHRDLKPANVMIDGTGKARITDFGLAGVSGEAIRAGTPAYMAPEQLAGGEVTTRSDIYALGLVLYEIFTGQRALDGSNLAELIHKREQSGITPPTAIVRDLDPAIERALLRCLRPTPEQRPASALLVAASLPGGDPLAAALAAGETPSPAMVAAAGGIEAVSRRRVMAAAAWIVVSLVAVLALYQRVMLINRLPVPKPPDALQDRAVEALARLGYEPTPAASAARGMGFSLDYARYVERTTVARDRWSRLGRNRPEALILWYRTSPRALVPLGNENPVAGTNPPLNAAGMTITVVDGSGRLSEFVAVPEPIQGAQAAPKPVDWAMVFELAGLPYGSFSPVTPTWVPVTFADTRMAWEGRLPEQPDQVVRLEAAAYAGKLVSLVIAGPWTRSARLAPIAPSLFNVLMSGIAAMVMPGLMLAGAILARRNLRLGRGDRRGAFFAATLLVAANMIAWVLRPHVMPLSADVQRLFSAIGGGLFDGALIWLTYLGLEPYVRRYSPDSLIGWTRLVAGRWNDPRVGADVMIGVSAGMAMTVLFAVHNVIPPLAGRPEPMPITFDATLLLGTREMLAYLTARLGDAVQSAMLGVVGIVALLIWLKRRWLAAGVGIIVYTPVALSGMFPAGTPILDLVIGGGIIAIFVTTIIRFGLLATMGALATHFVLLRAPLTLRLSAWYGVAGLWPLAVVTAMGLGACYLARRGAVRDAAPGDF